VAIADSLLSEELERSCRSAWGLHALIKARGLNHREDRLDVNSDSEQRAERLLEQLHQWAMEAIDLPREQRDAFVVQVAAKYYDDAVRNGLTTMQAEDWRKNVDEWLHSLIETIEVSGGAAGGHA